MRLGLMALPVAFFGLFFAYPVVAIVGRGLRADGVWRFGRIGTVLSRPDILDVLWFTTWQAFASTASRPPPSSTRTSTGSRPWTPATSA